MKPVTENTLYNVYADRDTSGPVEMVPENFLLSAPAHVIAAIFRFQEPAVVRMIHETATGPCRLHLGGRLVHFTTAQGIIVARVPVKE